MRALIALLLISSSLFAQSLPQQLRDNAKLFTDSADTIDQQSVLITIQAARIAELEKQLFGSSSEFTSDKIKYIGRAKVPNVGMTCSSLAYDPATDTFYTIGASGLNPFPLMSFKIDDATLHPDVLSSATNVTGLGYLNTNDPLKMGGQAMVSMKGLLVHEGKLHLNYCSYYANSSNLPVQAYVTLDGTKTILGPWKMTSLIHSDRVKGMTYVAPTALAEATGFPLISFGVRGSTSQLQSWGIGLTAHSAPGDEAPLSELPGKLVSYWPMKNRQGITPPVSYSDYPGDNQYPVVYLQRQVDGSVTKIPFLDGGILMQSGCFIGQKTLLIVGSSNWGNAWYGNPTDFQDVPSIVDPTKPTGSINVSRGGHIEAIIDKFWFVRVSDIVDKIKANDLRVVHYATGRMSEFGNPVLQTNTFGQMYYNEQKKLLYMLNHGSGNNAFPVILVFKVDA